MQENFVKLHNIMATYEGRMKSFKSKVLCQ